MKPSARWLPYICMVAAPFALLCRPNVTFFLYSNQSDNVLAELVPLWVRGREATFAAHSYPLSQDMGIVTNFFFLWLLLEWLISSRHSIVIILYYCIWLDNMICSTTWGPKMSAMLLVQTLWSWDSTTFLTSTTYILYLSLMINKILNIDIEILTPFVHLDFLGVQFGIENGSITYELQIPQQSSLIWIVWTKLP